MTKAVIFLPADQPLDGFFARVCMVHVERHNYELHSIVSEWDDVLAVIRNRYAQVVVFARQEHFDNAWEPRAEFVGDETTDLARLAAMRPRPRNERRSETGDSRSRRPKIAR